MKDSSREYEKTGASCFPFKHFKNHWGLKLLLEPSTFKLFKTFSIHMKSVRNAIVHKFTNICNFDTIIYCSVVRILVFTGALPNSGRRHMKFPYGLYFLVPEYFTHNLCLFEL